ncbi:hypothetical protein [Leekyejoonella antrihumi]|uniref:DUF2630 family protein n=1 Tax=Leekyejoonella antrihumi TaxID=1660198 RepID=A0A563DX30_9MICO|nr:hypothetical protein [Leekyejoonella antrihumi]TWP34848.1 hypothetical protein FGL98_15955 [Leekyejoonella antrihumi]
MEPVGLAVLSVRELIAQLSEVEDDLRRSRRGAAEDPEPALADLVHREQVIVHELRRRARSRQLGSHPRRASPPR